MNLKQCAHDYFLHKDCNCAEAVVMAANDTWGLGITPADVHLLSGFGGGMGCKRTCGALAGGVAIIGRLAVTDCAHNTPGFGPLCGEFVQQFIDKLGSDQCADLTPRYRTEAERCVAVVEHAAQLLEEHVHKHGLMKGKSLHGNPV